MLLVGKKTEISAMARAITPHSFRAGMASDLEREDVPRPVIKKRGRWSSDRAMEQYIRDGLAQKLTKIQFWYVTLAKGRVKRSLQKLIKQEESLNASEGYDESEEDSSDIE